MNQEYLVADVWVSVCLTFLSALSYCRCLSFCLLLLDVKLYLRIIFIISSIHLFFQLSFLLLMLSNHHSCTLQLIALSISTILLKSTSYIVFSNINTLVYQFFRIIDAFVSFLFSYISFTLSILHFISSHFLSKKFSTSLSKFKKSFAKIIKILQSTFWLRWSLHLICWY